MKFGPVALPEAEGAILAHSVDLPTGRLRKGVTLDASHVVALAEAGHAQVIVARLGVADLHENAAAEQLAHALAPNPQALGLRRSDAFTGRVNFLADHPGVALLDVDILHRINAVDPMITLATVPPCQQMAERGMVATVKIISYGVPEAHVAQASAHVAGAIRVAPVEFGTATLIVTEIPGGPGIKGAQAIRDRVEALGMELTGIETVPHQRDALAKALSQAPGEMVLILTGSATSDPFDVAPQAVRQAGGQVHRFGMPVDPGNLLFLGELANKPVIGLPGCARSPALNGADWVLARTACGIKVTAQDIAGMGVGGLLKEIPTRPQPRARRGKS